ncbi:hypothetical protein ACQP2T_63720 (plasmid) [Nonomuraea sp. CA-143628]|uniref:hypothetical protein n=1 Tax=Nonomuraea sp. CA-143628 TaxID=3239997 RepID=UPI003D8BB05E
MLDDAARKHRYLAQTGRREMTSRQRRRRNHKRGHQSVNARTARQARAEVREAKRAERIKNRLSSAVAAST